MIRRLSGMTALLLTMGLWLPGTVQAQKAPQPGNDVESDKLTPGTFVGKLKGGVIPGTDFELEIEYKHLVPKGGNGGNNNNNVQNLLRQQQQLAQAQQRIATARSPQQAAQAMQQLQRQMIQMQQQAARQNTNLNNLFKVVTEKRTIDFHAAENLIVRTNLLPGGGYDEKGNLKPPPTGAELKALKGDHPNLPGYAAKADDLKGGSTVVVTMKRAPAAKPDDDPKTAHKNVVTMVLIESEGQDTTGKKKNK